MTDGLTMRCIEIRESGDARVLIPTERPMPQAGAGEALIRVSASGVNRPDVMQRMGLYPPPPGASDLPGLEVVGVIVSGDAQALAAAGLSVGQRVCALLTGGGYAQYCVAPVPLCLPVPDGLDDVQAAALPETFFTVWSNVFDRAGLQAGETLLVQGGASGIGVTAIQLAKSFGATVIVTCGSDEKCAQVRKLGADHAINYRTQDFSEETRRLTGGRGADVILDIVAGDYVQRELDCLAEDGRLVIIAVQGGVKSAFNAVKLMLRRQTITGSTLRARPVAFKAAIAQALRQRVWPLLVSGVIKPEVHSVFEALQAEDQWPSGAARAHDLMEKSRHVGKIVLTWSTKP